MRPAERLFDIIPLSQFMCSGWLALQENYAASLMRS
jgi:hypothetical protein